MKKVVFAIAMGLTCLLPFFALAQNNMVVSGEVKFPKTGNIYISLISKEIAEIKDAKSPFGAIIEVSEKELAAKKVSFRFENVPAGMYAIRVFQDVNGNGDLDMGAFGPKEPWGTYRDARPKFRAPKFEEMAFEVKEEIKDIVVNVK
ncbi:putative exported protein [Candidatus Moduliflexus flocculans]|uniref:Putative exported protein n=1 Tax=Candidatus Moduliflexus flocculans TaxID=1499966 RepID=A0A0S6VTM7_9BACT|nr:putative exported protein [Candidatus Moduliflexus flocculans]